MVKPIHLTNDQYNGLNEVTRQTKTDCWFCISSVDDNPNCKIADFVVDLENEGKRIPWAEALLDLAAAIEPMDKLRITKEEAKGLAKLFKKFHIDTPEQIVRAM